MGFYYGINSKAKNAKRIFVGVDGKARNVKKAYIGVRGKARLVSTRIKKEDEITYRDINDTTGSHPRNPAVGSIWDSNGNPKIVIFGGVVENLIMNQNNNLNTNGYFYFVDVLTGTLTKNSAETEKKAYLKGISNENYILYPGGVQLYYIGSSYDSTFDLKKSVQAINKDLTVTQIGDLSSKKFKTAELYNGGYILIAGGQIDGPSVTDEIDCYGENLTKISFNQRLTTAKAYPTGGIAGDYSVFLAGLNGTTSDVAIGDGSMDAFDPFLTRVSTTFSLPFSPVYASSARTRNRLIVNPAYKSEGSYSNVKNTFIVINKDLTVQYIYAQTAAPYSVGCSCNTKAVFFGGAGGSTGIFVIDDSLSILYTLINASSYFPWDSTFIYNKAYYAGTNGRTMPVGLDNNPADYLSNTNNQSQYWLISFHEEF